MTNELYHHGVKGMKWGVRKDRNSDGSHKRPKKKHKFSTAYGRGKKYKKEYDEIKSKEYSRLKELNKAKFDKYYNEAAFLAKKYGLDEDDGGGGDTDLFSERQLNYASQRYLELYDKADYLDDQLVQKSKATAENYIRTNYGQTALNDISAYRTTNSIAVTAAFCAIYSGLVIAGISSSDKKK